MVGSSCYLSEELVEEIMSWLPADSLLRFKAVSKLWNALISALVKNPAFVAKQLHNMNTSSSTLSVFHSFSLHANSAYGRKYSLLNLFNDDNGDNKDHIRCVSEDLCLPYLGEKGRMWAYHCNGIICLVVDFKTITFCNPSLKECKRLSVSNNACNIYSCIGMGFGYDYRADDYKFVRIWFSPDVKAEVYKLSTNSWRDINVPRDVWFENRSAVYWRGVCYWVTLDSRDRDMILCFDMFDEEFYMIPFPNDVESGIYKKVLAVRNDSVALLLSFIKPSLPEVTIEVYMMSGFEGAKGSCCWTKSLIVGPLVGLVVTLLFWKNDELLMIDRDKELVSYNLNSLKLRPIANHGVVPLGHWSGFYVKSFVSLIGK